MLRMTRSLVWAVPLVALLAVTGVAGANPCCREDVRSFRRVTIVNFGCSRLECPSLTLMRDGKHVLKDKRLEPVGPRSQSVTEFCCGQVFADRLFLELIQVGAKQPKLVAMWPTGAVLQGSSSIRDVTLYVYDEANDIDGSKTESRARLGLGEWAYETIRARRSPGKCPKVVPPDEGSHAPAPGSEGGSKPVPGDKVPGDKVPGDNVTGDKGKDDAPFIVIRLENKKPGKKATASATVTPVAGSAYTDPQYYAVGKVVSGQTWCDAGATCDSESVTVCVTVENSSGAPGYLYYAGTYTATAGQRIHSVYVTLNAQGVVSAQVMIYNAGPQPLPLQATATPCASQVGPFLEQC